MIAPIESPRQRAHASAPNAANMSAPDSTKRHGDSGSTGTTMAANCNPKNKTNHATNVSPRMSDVFARDVIAEPILRVSPITISVINAAIPHAPNPMNQIAATPNTTMNIKSLFCNSLNACSSAEIFACANVPNQPSRCCNNSNCSLVGGAACADVAIPSVAADGCALASAAGHAFTTALVAFSNAA